MKLPSDDRDVLAVMVLAEQYYAGQATAPQLEHLQNLLRSSEECRLTFVRCAEQITMLRQIMGGLSVSRDLLLTQDDAADQDDLNTGSTFGWLANWTETEPDDETVSLDEAQAHAPVRLARKEVRPHEPATLPSRRPEVLLDVMGVRVVRSCRPRERRWGARLKQLGAVAAVLVMFFAVMHMLLPLPQVSETQTSETNAPRPEPSVVARITEVHEATWEGLSGPVDARSQPVADLQLLSGTRFHLSTGMIRMQMRGGASALLEGPATVRILDEQRIRLDEGRVVASTAAAFGSFTVVTPNAELVDIGTEFGALVDAKTGTKAHVFDGEIEMRVRERGTEQVHVHRLGTNEAARVDRSGQVFIEPITDLAARFARSLPVVGSLERVEDAVQARVYELDLADIVGGGDGSGSGGHSGIDLRTGRPRVEPDPQRLDGIRRYVLTPTFDLVDGLFVPDGRRGPVQVSSAGHESSALPATNGLTYDHIYGRADVYGNIEQRWLTTVLEGKRYGRNDRPGIYMHANKGITFDLQAIRDAGEGELALKRFEAVAGLPDRDQRGTHPDAQAAFWVLVDGEVRFHEQLQRGRKDAAKVTVELQAEDQFLSLVATEADTGTGGLWTIFGEPRLEVELMEASNE